MNYQLTWMAMDPSDIEEIDRLVKDNQKHINHVSENTLKIRAIIEKKPSQSTIKEEFYPATDNSIIQKTNAIIKEAESLKTREQFAVHFERIIKEIKDSERKEFAVEMIEKIAYRNQAVLKEKDWIKSVSLQSVFLHDDDEAEFSAKCAHLSFDTYTEDLYFKIDGDIIRKAEELKKSSRYIGDFDEPEDEDELFDFLIYFDLTTKPSYVVDALKLAYDNKLKELRK